MVAVAALRSTCPPARSETGWILDSAAPLDVARSNHSATLLDDGRVLVTGGWVCGQKSTTPTASSELWQREGSRRLPPMNYARSNHAAVLLADGRVLVVGGAPAETWDPKRERWSQSGDDPELGPVVQAVRLEDGRVLAVGGNGAATWQEGRWSPTQAMATHRERFSMTRLADGSVLVTGGYDAVDSDRSPWRYHGVATAERFVPQTGAWVATSPMRDARWEHRAALLSDGSVLVTGGLIADGALALASAEIWEPTSGTWHSIEPLHESRAGHTMTLLRDGSVLVFGKHGQEPTAERWDAQNGWRWTTVPPAPSRRDHSATLLLNGEVLILGGAENYPRLDTALLFSP